MAVLAIRAEVQGEGREGTEAVVLGGGQMDQQRLPDRRRVREVA